MQLEGMRKCRGKTWGTVVEVGNSEYVERGRVESISHAAVGTSLSLRLIG